MRRYTQTFCLWVPVLLASLLLRLSADAAPEIRLSSAGAPAGANVTVLLTLSAGTGVAAIRTQVNFDPQVLSVREITPGRLGSLFDFSAEQTDGRLFLIFARPDQLGSGQGILARISFDINRGAKEGISSDLAIAQLVAVNQAGANLGSMAEAIRAVGSSVTVSNLAHAEWVDMDQDGLADDWEDAHGLPTDLVNSEDDPDHDGRVNFVEYAFGSNPLVAESAPLISVGRHQIDGADYFSFSYSRNKKASNADFVVEASSDFGRWAVLAEGSSASEVIDMGETEKVVVRETTPMNLMPGHFIRVSVKRK